MSNGSASRSLTTQLLENIFLSLIAAATFFCCIFLLITFGDMALEKSGNGSPLTVAIERNHFSQLQLRIRQQQMTTESMKELDRWCRENLTTLTVYQGDTLLYETPVDETEDYGDAVRQSEGMLNLWDGTEVRALLSFSRDSTVKNWKLGISAVLSFVVFCLSFTALIHSKLRYIQILKGELDSMAGGQLEHPVPVLGYDELAELAVGMDEMRRSVLTHLREEDRIHSANSQLVAAMSHDLRTPLTSLMAFLELLDRQKYTDETQMRHLISQSLAQAESIRTMTNKLFEYFLVYATEWEQPVMETLDADALLRQQWQEYAFALESEGFRVEMDEQPVKGKVSVNLPLLRRAFDNVYANLLKYAEPDRPILIDYRRRGEVLALRVENTVSAQRDRRESTNIGLNTCRRVFRLHSGSFDTTEKKGVFRAEMTLPLL